MISDQLKTLLKIHASLTPPLISLLNPPASEVDIRAAENELQIDFPSELKELLLFANGQPYLSEELSPFVPGFRFADIGWRGRASYGWLLSIEDIVSWVQHKRDLYPTYLESTDETFETTGPVQFHDRFIDFTASENSDNLLLDMNPAPGGHVGQVVMMNTQPCHLAVLAPSLGVFLDMLIDGFQTGRFLPFGEEEGTPVWWDGGWEN
jgi:cell wall assembly regulator SMI1